MTVAPIILSSDKTQLSLFRGDKSAWPVYLTIGNLSKEVRRSPSMHGTVLLGYLPVSKFESFSEAARPLARYQAFHSCMSVILEELVKVGENNGTLMTCADRVVRMILPVLAAYVCDYPEQCLVAGCMENRCPIGEVAPDQRGAHQNCVKRDQREILNLLDLHRRGELSKELQDRFTKIGLRAIYEPFWRNLPFADIFQCFTPDLLHQLHKGVFKDHLVKWCTTLIGSFELDSRFKSAPTLQGLRHFKAGISKVSQWTGHEHKEMEKVFLALVAGAVDDEVVFAVRALMDFIHLASLQAHTTATLAALQEALDDFHQYKDVFIRLGARSPPHFNIPKYHMLEHYVALIRNFGSADGFNTEWSERLHIDYAKDAYRASNKKDYIAQMTTWLSRQEAVDRFSVYLEWFRNGEYQPQLVHELDPLPAGPTVPEDEPNSSVDSDGEDLEQAAPDDLKATDYHVARRHPRHLRSVPATKIIQDHGASQFIPALHAFLTTHGSEIPPYNFDVFDLYKQIDLRLPEIPEVSTQRQKLRNVVRASPPIPATGRKQREPAHLDCALVHTGEVNEHTDGTGLQGMLVLYRIQILLKSSVTDPCILRSSTLR